LLMLTMYQQVKLLDQQMKKMKLMMMYAALLGDAAKLRQDVIAKVFDVVFLSADVPRQQSGFEQLLEKERARLMQEGQQIIKSVDAALQAHADAMKSVQASVAAQKQVMLDDVKSQCDALMGDRFVLHTPAAWLRHLPRFLKGIEIRVEKAGRDLQKDARLTAEVRTFWLQYEQRAKILQQRGTSDEKLTTFRWMIEELRISMFAQELKTSMPISVKRLEKYWQAMR